MDRLLDAVGATGEKAIGMFQAAMVFMYAS
jgi:hypothetical protein